MSLRAGIPYRWSMHPCCSAAYSTSRTPIERVAVAILAALLGLTFTCGRSLADDVHDRYFQGLRERRLFSVAEGYALRRLAEPGLPAITRTELTIELSRTLAEHATYRTGQEQEELWRQARGVIEDLLRASPDNPRADQLELQAAIILALRGASLRWRVELAFQDSRIHDQALLQLQSAVSRLQEVESRLQNHIKTAHVLTPAEQAEGAPGRAELRELAREAAYRMAIAYLDLGRILPAGPNRTAALHEANQRFVQLSPPRSNDDISLTCRLYRAEIARRQSDPDAARALLDALERDSKPGIEHRIAAERVRLELDRDRPDLALQQLLDFGHKYGTLTDELAALNVEALLDAWDVARARGESDLAAELIDKARRIDATIGQPWRARSRMLLETATDAARYGRELADVIRAARSAWQNGDIDQAGDQYGLAITQALGSDQKELAHELQLTRASILLQSARYSEAATEFRAVADNSGDTDQKGDAHLLYAYCLGKQWEDHPSPEHRAAYVAALEEHRQQFAGQSSRDEATWMLACVLDAGNEWEAAIDCYSELPSDYPRAAQARARIAALYEQQLQHLRETDQPTSAWEVRAVEQLTGFLDYFPVPPARLDRTQAEIAVRLARILLNRPNPSYADADALLKRVRQSCDIAEREAEQDRQTVDDGWNELSLASTRLQIVALAGQAQTDQARELLTRLDQTGPQELLTILSGLAEISRNTDARVRRELADLQIQAADRLMRQRDQLDATSQWLLDKTRAEAYEVRGRPHDALIVYDAMLKVQPRNKRLVRKRAELLASTGDAGELEQAYDSWKQLMGLEKRGTRGWLQARYELAACSLQLGRVEEARKLVGVTKLLYPDLGGADLRQRFTELETRIAAAGEL